MGGPATGADPLSGMGAALTALAARAVVGTDGDVWTANSAFCSLVALDEPALRHLGWRQLVHPADRQYVAAHLVEILAGNADLASSTCASCHPTAGTCRPACAWSWCATATAARAGSSWRPGQLRRILAAMDVVETAEDAAGLELPPLVVREPLEAFLDAHGIGEGRLEAERIGEGHSNITFLVKRGNARVVLRRPPRPPLPPSAHDVLREARLLKALEGTPVRVPTVIAVGDDETVLGVPFYVMEEIHGSVLASAIPPAIDTADERRRTAEELVDALVELHNVDWRACGLEGYGKPTGYLERQVRRFSGLWEHNKTRELPVVEELGEWLGRNMPESPESTIVHGDYRLGNVMMANAAPAELVAIFDWELSTIGDPLADVGYLTVTWVEPDDPQDTMFANLNAVTRSGGFLTREEIIARYEERSGRSMSALNWYQALALWKAAVFMEGNYKRFQAGNSDDEYLGLFDRGVPMLAEKAREIAHS